MKLSFNNYITCRRAPLINEELQTPSKTTNNLEIQQQNSNSKYLHIFSKYLNSVIP